MVLKIYLKHFCDSNNGFSHLFHPDNIKNPSTVEYKRSVSVHELWAVHGGAKGLAVKLRTDVKVNNHIFIRSNHNSLYRKVFRPQKRTF
jgi:hypothetical protein